MRTQEDGARLVLARKALGDVWRRCFQLGCVGRSWSARGKNNVSKHPGSNIVLSDGDVMIVIFQEGAVGPIRVAAYKRLESDVSYPLIKDVKKRLFEEGLL